MTNVAVLTEESIETIIAQGGTRAWALNPRTVAHCQYVICTRNGRKTGNMRDHRQAFLVGKIKGITPMAERFQIDISEYALVDFRAGWAGSNPINYGLSDDLISSREGVLKWTPVSGSVVVPQRASLNDPEALIAEAKAMIAKAKNVPVENVTIFVSV